MNTNKLTSGTALLTATKPATKAPSKKAIMRASKHHYSHIGVIVTIVLSAGLNGLANATHATNHTMFAIGLGIVIPCLVFLLSKVGGNQYANVKTRKLSYFTACVCLLMLAVSISHCAASIESLTGMHIILAWMMAIVVDLGLVCFEIDLVLG